MRRKDRQTSQEHALQVVDQSLYAALSLVNPNGTPYCVPISVAREGRFLYFHSAAEGKKLTGLRENPNVCLSFVLEAENLPLDFSVRYDSAIVTGKAQEVLDEAEKIEALRLISLRHASAGMDKFDGEIAKHLKHTVVMRIEMLEVTGKGRPR